jgi:hypothetical protein
MHFLARFPIIMMYCLELWKTQTVIVNTQKSNTIDIPELNRQRKSEKD